MRPPLYIGIIFCFAALFSILEIDRQPHVAASLWSYSSAGISEEALGWPIDTSQSILISGNAPEHLRIEIKPNGYELVGNLNIKYTGDNSQLFLHEIGQTAREKRSICEQPNEGGVGFCKTLVRTKTDSHTIFLISGLKPADSVIADASLSFVSAKRITELDYNKICIAFVGLALVGPLIAALRKRENLQLWILILIGCLWLISVSPYGAGIFFLFVSSGYCIVAGLKKQSTKSKQKLYLLLLMIILSLGFFKFGAPALSAAFANPGALSVALPLGISYLAIRLIDLCISAHSGTLKGLNFQRFLAFMVLPHTLLAGPIFTFENFNKSQIQQYTIVDFSAGIARITLGLTKKLASDALLLPIVASNVSALAVGNSEIHWEDIWAMLLANLLFVYLDFSAYCDLAIGSGRTAGIKVPENFNLPLVRSGIGGFWRNWHMTLSNWVMRRVYFSVFLSFRSRYLSTLSCMLVIAVWHAPTLSWLAWAVHHGSALHAQNVITEKLSRKSFWQKRKDFVSVRWATYSFGVVFVWFWVALGHSFTLFTDAELAFGF